ncbi:MAG: hypothetical protein WD208_04475 [Dehalococcoidia bacterium]
MRSKLRAIVVSAAVVMLGVIGCSSEPPEPTEAGFIYTFAGADEGFAPDAEDRHEARFGAVSDLVAAGGWLYVADGAIVSRINLADGAFEVVAGNGSIGPMPESGPDIRQTALPSVRSLDVDAENNRLYALLFDNPDAGVVQVDLGTGEYELLFREEHLTKIRLRDDNNLLFMERASDNLVNFELATRERRDVLPGVHAFNFAVADGQVVYILTSHEERAILRADFRDSSVTVVVDSMEVSPLLRQVREDAEALQNPYPMFSYMAVAPTGDIAFVDSSRYGHTVGTLDPGEGNWTLVAGTGPIGDAGDGGPATDANVRSGPIAFDDEGNLYMGHKRGDLRVIRRINSVAE